MKLNPVGRSAPTAKDRYPSRGDAQAGEQKPGGIPERAGEERDTVFAMQDALKKEDLLLTQKTTEGPKFPVTSTRPRDRSSQLTRRLVAATGQVEVRGILSEASSNLVQLRMAAALCKGKEAESAKAAIRNLEKLISRASRKVKELDQEDMIRIRKAKAEKKRQDKRVEEIKRELREKQQKRMAREHNYLFHTQAGPNPADPMDPASEAQIAMEAAAIAAAEASFGGDGGGAALVGEGGGEGASSAEGAGEGAAQAGGELSG